MKVETLEGFLSQYQPEKVVEYKQITIGVSNEAYYVVCASGSKYVIRIIHLQTAESVRAEALIQQAMSEHGISTPVYVPLTGGNFVGQDGSTTFTIAPYVSGKHPDHASLKLAKSLGEVMAELHNILNQDEIHVGYNTGQWLNPRNVALDIARCNVTIRKRLQSIVDLSSFIFEENLPMAIIHGELATNNVFAEEDEVTTLFDFETTEYAPRILDVAYTYLSLVYDEELKPAPILRALKKGYDGKAKTPLTALEDAYFTTAVRYVSAATAAWCFSRGYDEYGEKFFKAGTI